MYDFDLVVLQISLLKVTFKKLILDARWITDELRGIQGHIRLAYYHKISIEKYGRSVKYYGHLMTKHILQSKEKDVASTLLFFKIGRWAFKVCPVNLPDETCHQVLTKTDSNISHYMDENTKWIWIHWIWIHCKSHQGQWYVKMKWFDWT